MDFVTCKLVHSILRSIYILIKLNDEGNPVALISYFHSAFDRITMIFDQEITFTLEGSPQTSKESQHWGNHSFVLVGGFLTFLTLIFIGKNFIQAQY